MKIALCVGNLAAKSKYGPQAYLTGFNHLKEKILNKNNSVDVFLHSYEPEIKDQLIELYRPVYSLFEPLADFNQCWKDLPSEFCSGSTQNYSIIFSMFYSRYVVGQLKNCYEKKNNFVYDWVIFARYDLTSAHHIVDLPFDSNLDNNFVYTAMFDQINAGPNDQWFYGNSLDMDIVFSAFLRLNEYFEPNSEYIKAATNNWFDSNINDRFSCELFKTNKSNTGENININAICNAHYLYKWHLFASNFWSLDKLKFTISEELLKNYPRILNIKHLIENHKNVVWFDK